MPGVHIASKTYRLSPAGRAAAARPSAFGITGSGYFQL
jgi:hypothetical protein